ncbi:DNA-directed RNA polymerase subunit delta [Geobacillus stearothermophilus]|uniref:DNA-directed RNA polymerase subunit delta n=1 Tax=Geobacillus stearothermophilus TaxID=1422 RepID=UPI001363A9FA|nr:DNA-directed RNA polymerase subunit delta [Geobacillus stearothermophilus]
MSLQQQYSPEELQEMSFVELANLILLDKREALPFDQIVREAAALTGMAEDDIAARLAQYYTDLNIDGRFICVGENVWGLRAWYPFDQTEDETVTIVKPKKKKKALDDEYDDYEELLDEEDLDYDDLGDYDAEELELDDEELLEDEEFDLDEDVAFDDEDILDDEPFDLDDEPLDEELDLEEAEEDE